MFGRLRIVVLSASALWHLSTAVPADPTITTAAVLPRQNNDNFIGYLELNNTWNSFDCDPGLTWYQSGQYAQCCPATLPSCYAATACVGGSQIYTYPDISSVRTIACTENYNNAALSICNTIYIFENSQDSDPKTNINCGDKSVNWSYYRDLPASATGEVSATSSTIDTAPSQSAEPSSSSKAWIAGAVVGPILGLALVGFVVWFCLRRRKKAAHASQQGTASMAPINPSQPPAGVAGYTDAKPQLANSQPDYYNQPGQPDPYAQQGYPQQGGYAPAPQMSPTPQYGYQSAYAPPPNSPPPGAYTHDVKYENASGAAELGGGPNGIAPAAPVSPGSPPQGHAFTSQAAELSGGDIGRPGDGLPGSAELPTTTHSKP